MPQRPRSHWLETESRRAFEAAISPTLHFYERPKPEYGIDGEVEEFDTDGRTTGLHFFIQLKGSDEADLRNGLAVDVELDTADYYRAAPLPVLMIRYHAPSERLFPRWFHQYDPYYGRGGKKTLTFRWEESDAWELGTPGRLVADARAFLELRRASLCLPQPLYVVTSGAFGLSPAEISIALRAATSERSDLIDARAGPPRPGCPWIEVTDKELIANLAKITTATLHIRERHDLAARTLAADALVLVALAFEHIGQDDLASRLAAQFLARSSMAGNLDIAAALSYSTARAHRISEALKLSEALDEAGGEELEAAAFMFTFPALYESSALTEVELEHYEQVLKRRAQRRKKKGDSVRAGQAYMNLASFHRSRGSCDKAVSYYEQALKLDVAYALRSHYWFELGGACWGTRQFVRSAEAYARAIELGTSEPNALALHADALMFSGRYSAAMDLFSTFNAAHLEGDGEYRLKVRALAAVTSRLGIREQKRQTKKALDAAKQDETGSADRLAEASLRQLAQDALWGSAWLNLGMADLGRGRPENALEAFIASTVLIVQDFEAWQNAIVTAFMLDEEQTLVDLVVSGRRMAGDALIDWLIEVSRTAEPDFPRDSFLATLDSILGDHPPDNRRTFTVRMLSEGSMVEEILVREEPDDAPPSGAAV